MSNELTSVELTRKLNKRFNDFSVDAQAEIAKATALSEIASALTTIANTLKEEKSATSTGGPA